MLLAQVARNHDLPFRRHCRRGHNLSYYSGKTTFPSALIAQFEHRAEEVYKTQGLAFLKRVKEVLPPTNQPIAVDGVLKRLEQVSPGFIEWGASLSAAKQPASAAAQSVVSDPVYPAGLDAPMLARPVDAHLADARAAVERLVAVQGPRTAANTLRPFDDASNHVKVAEGLTAIAAELHADSAIRDESQRAEERISRLHLEFGADPTVAGAARGAGYEIAHAGGTASGRTRPAATIRTGRGCATAAVDRDR
jgi:hypothetical protein